MRVAVLRKLGAFTLLVASALACVQCGPAIPEVGGTLSERTVARLVAAPRVYAASAGGAGGAAVDADTAALVATFEGALDPTTKLRVRHDPALDLAAAALAENFSDQGKGESAALTQWLLWRTGSVALYRSRKGGFVGGRTRSQTNHHSLEMWARRAAEQLNDAPGSSLSYGVSRLKEGKITAETILFATSPFVVAPFSKTYTPGGPLTLAIRPLLPISELRVSIGSDSAVEEESLAPRPDGSFFLSRAVPSRPGRYFVEIQGPLPARRTLLVVPIYVGVPEPTEPDDFIQHPPAGPGDLAGWQGWLAARYDAERAKVGRPPVEVDPRFTALATERSTLVSGSKSLPRAGGGFFSERVGAMGFSSAASFEAITYANSTDAILANLLRPSVRKRLVLSPRVIFGAAASARPPEENTPPASAVVEEAVLPEPQLPASPAPPASP